jgi:hypothetical protein
MAGHPHLTRRSADKRQTAALDYLPQRRRVIAGTRSSPTSSHLSLRANTSPSRDGLPAKRRAQPSTQGCAPCRRCHTGTQSGDRRRPAARSFLRTRGEACGCCAWSHAQRAAVVAPSSIPTPSSPGFYQPSMALPDGGHVILPIGGHRNSPLAAANSPHGRPSFSPPIVS